MTIGGVFKYLEFFHQWKDGRAIMGASSLTGRYWTGYVWCFDKPEDALDDQLATCGFETQSGIGDGICFSDNMVILGMDSGAINVLQLQSDNFLCPVKSSYEHDDIVSSLSLNSDETKVISSSYDNSIKVWDIESWNSVITYRPGIWKNTSAHGDIVWKSSASTTEPEVFISCGQDGNVILWDLRIPKPATVIEMDNLKSIPTCVSWQPESPTVFAVGGSCGSVLLKDIRGSSLYEFQPHKRSVYRLIFSPHNPNRLSSSALEETFYITDLTKGEPNEIYKDNSHSDFVRDLLWSSDDVLYSCGWDKQVKRHNIKGVMELNANEP